MDRLEDKVCVHDAEVEKYREKIVEMVGKIENARILNLIHAFIESGYEEELAGRT